VPRPAGDTRTWRQRQIVPLCGAVSITISIATWRRLRHHLQDPPRPPTRGNTAWPRGPLPLCLFTSLSLSLSRVPEILPFAYKREGWVPHLKRRTSIPLHLHQRPETSSLSRQFVTPTTNFSAGSMSGLELDVGTFCPIQYTSLCPPAHHPGQTRNINLPIGGSKRRQVYFGCVRFCLSVYNCAKAKTGLDGLVSILELVW
jgi:hypothetical protein